MVQKLLFFVLSSLFISSGGWSQTVWNGPIVTFTKVAGADPTLSQNQDRITSATWITRGDFEGLYNAVSETFFSNNSPENTEWATGSLTDYATLNYQHWVDWAGGRPNIQSMIGKGAVLHLKTENIYIGIKFLSWDNGHNSPSGGFSYQRTTAPVLPVKLINFTATKLRNSISPNWKTASEENTSSFSIERSADGKEFLPIGTVAAAGSSSAERFYSFSDAFPLSANFYRLRTNDRDGAFSYSTVLAFKLSRPSSLQVFPNPAATTLNLQYRCMSPGMAQIVDPSGRVVRRILLPEGENALTIDIATLKSGVYLLRTEAETKSFVKH